MTAHIFRPRFTRKCIRRIEEFDYVFSQYKNKNLKTIDTNKIILLKLILNLLLNKIAALFIDDTIEWITCKAVISIRDFSIKFVERSRKIIKCKNTYRISYDKRQIKDNVNLKFKSAILQLQGFCLTFKQFIITN